MATPDLAGLLRRNPAANRPAPTPAERPLSVLRNEPVQPAESAPAATTPVEAPAPPKPVQRREPATPPATTGVATKARTAARPPAPDRRQYLRSITVYIPRSLHQQVRAAASARATTATALMLAAINDTHDRLAPALAPAEPPKGKDLFDIPQVRAATEPTVQTTIRITDRQLDAIVELTDTHGVNRSQLIATALRLYLS